MKKYRNPNVPTPTPSPSPSGEGMVKPPRYVGKPVPVPSPTPPTKKKRKPAPGLGVKRRDVSGEQLVPRRVKPTPSRRRFLDELNEMNKRSR